MVLMSYFQFYFLCDFASFVKTSIYVSDNSGSWKWDSGDVKSFNKSVVNEVFCGTTVHKCLSVGPFVPQTKYYFGVYHPNIRLKHIVWEHYLNDGHVIQAAEKSTPLSYIAFIH